MSGAPEPAAPTQGAPAEPRATARLAGFVAEASPGDLPERLFGHATRYVLDTLGVIAFGATRPWARAAAAVARRAGTGPCSVIAHTGGAPAAAAAFVNGVAGHAFELDDVHDESILHPGAVVVPAALAMAEEQGASGPDLLLAVILGYEAMARAGLAVGPSAHMLRGFHPTGTSGVFGAAAAAGRLLALDAERMRDALGIAASFAGGLMEFSQTGGEVKRLHAGRAAEGGLTAALLAAEGVRGPSAGLDGRFGFCRTFSDAPDLALLTEGLGERFMIDEITVKPYACCSDVHPVIDALLEIRARHAPDPGSVAAIEVEGPTKVAEQNSLDGTTSVMAAQYSVRFTAAAALMLDPTDPRIYREEVLADPALRRLHDRVRVSASADLDATYARKIGARVRVRMVDGTVHAAEVLGARGSVHRPLSEAEVESKFRALAAPLTGDAGAEDIRAAVRGLAAAPDLSALRAAVAG